MTICAGVDTHINHPGVGSETSLSNRENMLVWNDVDFSRAIPESAFTVLAKMATAAGYPTLESLPTEMLIHIHNELSPQDQIMTAFALPELFMNSDRFHTFFHDAYLQLRIPTYVPGVDLDRLPLLQQAIRSNLSLEQITLLLDIYADACEKAGVDRRVFLDAEFPDNKPVIDQLANLNLDPGASRSPGSDAPHRSEANLREILTPLHVAVSSGRVDIVRLLIAQGADVSRVVERPDLPPSTPLQYALYLLRPREQGVNEISEAERATLLQIAADLLQHSPNVRPYTRLRETLSRELFLSIDGGADHIVLTILTRVPPTSQADNLRSAVLQRIMCGRLPIPESLKYVLDNGALWRETAYYMRGGTSMACVGIRLGNLEHAAIGLEQDIANSSSVTDAYVSIVRMAVSGNNDRMVERLVQILAKSKYRKQQHHIFVSTFLYWRPSSLITRQIVLQNANIINEETLRFCIGFTDRVSTAYVISRMIESGQSIDERVPKNALFKPRGDSPSYYDSPLTYAIALSNYHAAAQLLSAGAKPGNLRPSIRRKVRHDRDRAAKMHPGQLIRLCFNKDQVADLQETTHSEAVAALDYVFARILDDPELPDPGESTNMLMDAYEYIEEDQVRMTCGKVPEDSVRFYFAPNSDPHEANTS
ncbi:hypothetical protein NPX13_g8514 [Xylaria arbuscula]|uniref:Uncharacterized protein n=1 Tax=Xylaria arbuscula TaxID=114810 RepID=A0A9W8N8F7_9PEZI|nr:hypothetical protein NPX13_g8514 [Xylaria arbuscula]